MQDALYDGFGMWPDAPGPVEQTWGVPSLDGLVGRRHMGIHGGVPARCVVADMTGNAGAAVEQLDSGCRQPGIDFLPSKAVGRIEIIPMIDVMFFMLSSLAMQNLDSLQVNLPEGKAEKLNADKPVTLTLTGDSKIFVNRTPVTLQTMAATPGPLLNNAQQSIVVSADNVAPQGIVVQAMLQARAAGAKHFLIAVKHE